MQTIKHYYKIYYQRQSIIINLINHQFIALFSSTNAELNAVEENMQIKTEHLPEKNNLFN